MAETRTYTAGRFAVDIDGYGGYIKKVSGLGMTGEVVTNDLGSSLTQTKQLANIKWEPGKITVGAGMGKGLHDWIKSAFERNFLTKTGSVISADFNNKAQSVLEFSQAIITGFTVPKLDGASKDAVYFDVDFEAEQVRWKKGGGEDIGGKIGSKQKAWLCSNFMVEIGALPCSRVSSVDSFSFKCSFAQDQVGILREATKHPAKVTVPDLKLTISHADYDPWAKAAHSWFVEGNHLEKDHMAGRILFLGPDLNIKKPVGEIELMGVGFKSFKQDDAEAGKDGVKRFTPELYVEGMKFQIHEYDA